MKTSELISRIAQCKATTPLKDQTVEVVVGSKKYFICEVDHSDNSLVFKVTRKNYKLMGHQEFMGQLERGSATGDCLFLNVDGGGEPLPVTTVFISPNYLEISLDPAADAV